MTLPKFLARLACRYRGHLWRRSKAIGAGAKQCARCGRFAIVKARKAKKDEAV
jgi:hypothetical protein